MDEAQTADSIGGSDTRGLVKGLVKGTLLSVVKLGLTLLLLFGTAGRWDWAAGWVCFALLTASSLAALLILKRKNPGLLERRMRIGEGTKSWDKVLVRLIILLPAAIIAVAALDAVRFGWSSMPGWLVLPGAALYAVGVGLVTWAMVVNNHFEGTVRIQSDIGHRVVDRGPYRLVRHPGYSAMLLVILGLPLVLGSWWAFLPAALNAALLVLRTALEDRTLQEELAGYADFTRRVRYRLMPYVW